MHQNEYLSDEDSVRPDRAMDVAIVGMSCRFPAAGNYAEYWRNLITARNCIREVPADRWDWRRYFGDPRVEPNKTGVKWGGFIDGIDQFDPLFFGIAPNEAAFIDPQHRLFLEAAWHAVEDAGYSIASLSGRNIGVYAGVSKNDYSELMRETRHEIVPYVSTGTVHSILANRVSFLFNLHGRSESVDTACSSSLVALHNAIRDIANGECEAAIVGGVNALITPTMFISHSKSGMLSPDGQCRTFSATANGYVRGEGVGVLFIKPLRRALRDGDHVHAVIKSTAINHGGRSNFLTSPTTEAQAAVVTMALRRGGIDPRTIDYIEAHGTGTPLGDPIEINGLKKAFAQWSSVVPHEPYCAVGSVKTNVGHLESAAGMAGIIKVVMAMKHARIPAIRNFEKLNPYIELAGSPFLIATEARSWERGDHPRRAGVSSFGMGGVNAHVVLEEAPEREVNPVAAGRGYVIPLSAKKGRLKPYAESLLSHLRQQRDLSLRDVAHTLQVGRDAFDERLAIVASSMEELISRLEGYVAGDTAALSGPANVDVHLDQRARRIPLPGYPFARRRCWFTDVPSKTSSVPPAESDSATKSLRSTDFFIRDHVVQGKPTLPGVVHLELARAAAAARLGNAQHCRVLKDVYWMTPVVVDHEDVRIDVKLAPQNDGLAFEIVQGRTVHSKGGIAGASESNRSHLVDLSAIRSRCNPGKSKADLYELFRTFGLAYGSTFRSIENFVHNDREILAELRLPDGVREDFVLHPSLMDGVFQTVTALSLLGEPRLTRQFVPFHLESAEIVKPVVDHCFVYAAVAEAGAMPSFHAQLLDDEGNVLVELTNLQKRPVQAAQTSMEVAYYRPEWHRRELPQQTRGGERTLLVFANDASALASFAAVHTGAVVLVTRGESYRRVANGIFEIDPHDPAHCDRLLQDLKAEGLAPAQIAYLWGLETDDLDGTIHGVLDLTRAAIQARLHGGVTLVYAHAPGPERTRSVHAMVAGFARTLKYENPKFDYRTVEISAADIDAIARVVCAELDSTADVHPLREVRHRDGRRYERVVVRETVPEHREGGIQRGRVVLVSGGAGGLGAVFSRHLAEKYEAKLLWLGRSAMTPGIARKIREIEQAGGTCEYFRVDITDRDALAQVFARIKERHPEIHGVIHAAAVIEDAFILRKPRESFARVIAPKVLGALNLDDVTRNEPLDFFFVFSSIAALMPNQGQCDYASANSFLDAFVESRNRLVVDKQRSGVSLALNWPLWADGGIRVSADEERHLLRVFGMRPLPTPDGLAIFETSLATAKKQFPAIHQLIAIGGDREKIERCLGVVEPEPSTGEAGPRLQNELAAIFAARLHVPEAAIHGDRTLGELGIDSTAIVGAIRDINERFGTDLKPTLLFDINTVDKLAAHLVEIGRSTPAVPRWNASLIDVDRSDPARRTFHRTFRTSEFYLRDHVVDGLYNMPGACYVEMARQAGDLLPGGRSVTRLLHNYWASPLSSPKEDFSATVHLTEKQDHLAYEIVSFAPNGEKRVHALGQLVHGATVDGSTIDLAAVRSRCAETQHPPQIYAQIHGEGLHVGPTFQPMREIVVNEGEALAVLELPEEIRATSEDYVLHPALLTGVFQCALINNRRNANNARRYIPIGMDELEILAPIPPQCYVYSRPRPSNARNEEMRKFDVEVCGPDGVVVVRLNGFSIRALRENAVPETRAQVPTTRGEAPAEALSEAVRAFIQSKMAGPIGLPADEIDPSVEFDQYGVTSVMVVELNQIFEEIVGPIPKTLFFEYRNVAELAAYFVQNHGDVLARLLPPTPEPPAVRAAGVPAAGGDVREYLRSLIAGPIGLAAEEIDFQTGFDQYGVSSVMIVELNEIFERVFGPLSRTLFFEYRSIDELAGYFLQEHADKLASILTSEIQKPHDHTTPAMPSHSRGSRSDIAIVSAAGRFPGARNLEEFWDVLREGRDCITEIPPGRFNYQKYFDANPEHNRIYSKWGGFIADVDKFDPTFFNISPREAELIDPQERLLLEVVWEMLERAGYTRQRLQTQSERRVGVFVGALWQPYESAGIEATAAGNVVGPSSLLYSIANRISYYFDLAGPSMAIDTACSSSLTALHLACQSIRNGESRFAIAAGVNLSLSASKYLFLSQNRFLSMDGRCRSYGAGGSGYVPGEGVCSLLLKPLPDAIADGDSILAVIKGSALNHGGRTNGYTVPSPKAQGNVIAEALEQSGVDPNAISYIDGHGTGTSLGDPIEIEGLEKALGRKRGGDCAIGSVKSNIGHLEAAAGIASTIKVILQMQNGLLVPSLHAEELNPNIDFGKGVFRVQRELAPWTRAKEMRRCAGVSSFGAGGSNAHVILEEYDGPPPPSLRDDGVVSGAALCVFSAKTEGRLAELVARFRDHLRDAASGDLHDIAYTLQVGREGMPERLAVVAASIDELGAALDAFLQHREPVDWRRGTVPARKAQKAPATAFELIEAWWRNANLLPIAESWVQGAEIDWSRLYPRRYGFLPLPAYPFADERYWLDTTPVAKRATAGVLHPLLHRNTSDLSEQRYSTRLSGDEFFLAHHRVRTDEQTSQRVLPGVAHLEIARAAIEEAMPARPEGAILELRNTVWAQPVFVTGDRQIDIALAPQDDGGIEYEIYSEEGGADTALCQGRAVWSREPAPAKLDLDALQRQMVQARLEPEAVYAPCARTGLVLGPAFRTVTDAYLGNNQVLAHLRLPAVVEDGAEDFVLHPSMMDGALHGSVGMIDGWIEGSNRLRLPFSLETLRVIAPCKGEMVSWIRYASGSQPGDQVVKIDVDLCDAQGNVCVQMHGFSTRLLTKEAGATTNRATEVLLAAPVWQMNDGDAIAGPIDSSEQHVLLCGLTHIESAALAALLPRAHCTSLQTAEPRDIGQRYGEYALTCFERIQAILRQKPARPVRMQIVIADDREHALLAGLSGMLKTAAMENPLFAGQSIFVPPEATAGEVADLLRNEPSRTLDVVVRYRGGAREVLRWEETEAPDTAPVAFGDRGVYLITGGLGGLGTLFAREILTQARGARVVLTGRSAFGDEIRSKLDALWPEGGRLGYRQADPCNVEQVKRLVDDIRDEHGALNGILHCAGMIADGFILRKDAAGVREVLAPKVTGTVHLDEATRSVNLDFFVLFSSTTSAFGNVGQADYAAANGFMDQFAAYRNRQVVAGERHGRTRSIHWPLWMDGRMGVDPATHEQLRRTIGVEPMQTATGLEALRRILALPRDEVMVMEGDGVQMRRALRAGTAAVSEPQPAPVIIAADGDPANLADKTQEYLRKELSGLLKLPPQRIDPHAALEEYGIDSILAMKLTTQLEKTFGSLPKTLFFEYQTIRALAEYFSASHSAKLVRLLDPDAGREIHAAPAETATSNKLHSTRRFSRLRTATHRMDHDPIAIVGLSGRYPQAFDLETFWQNLCQAKDCIIEVPKERWDWKEYFSADRSRPGHHYSKWGGFIEGVDEFDPLFFNISPLEAEVMDPQERLFLQHAWAAIEDAGYTRASLQLPHDHDLGGQAGVYVGVWCSEYQLFGAEASLRGKRQAIAISIASIANRVSYAFNLHGPSMTLDTMCAASLTAIHIACQDLKLGRTNLAIAGGVNLNIHPNKYLMLSAAQAISSEGHCRSFGEGGEGYIPAEGVGVVVLKRLSEARRDGDHIYAVIRGSALNHGGKTNGYTVPNPQAQTSAISRALVESQIDPRHISYIETHGTGTKLGDPIEIAALSKAFRQSTQDLGFCRIGSVKSNIGHCESAAGIAGLTKVLLQMQHEQLVPSLHSAQLNPHIDFGTTPFVVNQELRPWERPVVDGHTLPRIAGISSFGAGGSNAHMIVEEYQAPVLAPVTFPRVAIVLSARTSAQLQQKARDLLAFVRPRIGSVDLVAIAYTLQIGREAMEERLAFIAASAEELVTKLEGFVAGEGGIEDVWRGQAMRENETVSMFTGDADLQQTVEKWLAAQKLSKVLGLWVKGLELDWNKFYGEARPQRMSLPTYPFARQRYWIDAGASDALIATAGVEVLHPLVHQNTSDLSEQCYSTTLRGDEFFLADHRIRMTDGTVQKVLPGVAYLEMARAAVLHASRRRLDTGILELHDAVWLKPVVIAKPAKIEISLFENDDDGIDYEIRSGEADHVTVHCQGRARFRRAPAPAKLDVEQLRRQMHRGSRSAAELYAMCDRMGLAYGPAHQSIAAIDLGDDELLAHLRLPDALEADREDYVLHPSVMDGALQAVLALVVDPDQVPGKPFVPFALASLRVVSACTKEMTAWVRVTRDAEPDEKTVRIDLDLCDPLGNICVEIRGFAARTLDAGTRTVLHGSAKPRIPIRSTDDSSAFDDAFYESLITDVLDHRLSIDDAVEVG